MDILFGSFVIVPSLHLYCLHADQEKAGRWEVRSGKTCMFVAINRWVVIAVPCFLAYESWLVVT